MRKAIRSAVGRVLLQSRLHRTLLNQHAVILAFHRITRNAPSDAISIDQQLFQQICTQVPRHFAAASLPELVGLLGRTTSFSGQLTITFDDGYIDNFETCAPMLEAAGLPATFFVTTSMIGTDKQTSWDKHQGIASRWMTWDHVRDLRRRGFEIGAHTMTHANLAGLEEDAAREELLGSKTRLEQELGEEVRLFSYPFGGKEHVNAMVRRVAKEIGFECCLSCHGGLVTPGMDVFELPRIPVNKYYTDYWHLGAALARDALKSRLSRS